MVFGGGGGGVGLLGYVGTDAGELTVSAAGGHDRVGAIEAHAPDDGQLGVRPVEALVEVVDRQTCGVQKHRRGWEETSRTEWNRQLCDEYEMMAVELTTFYTVRRMEFLLKLPCASTPKPKNK